jgi:hypothetical protein
MPRAFKMSFTFIFTCHVQLCFSHTLMESRYLLQTSCISCWSRKDMQRNEYSFSLNYIKEKSIFVVRVPRVGYHPVKTTQLRMQVLLDASSWVELLTSIDNIHMKILYVYIWNVFLPHTKSIASPLK